MDTEAEKIIVRVPSDNIDKDNVLEVLTNNRASFMKYMREISDKNYLHWEKARFVQPPDGITAAEAWHIARDIRKLGASPTPVNSDNGDSFTLFRPNYTDRLLREIDMHTGGDFIVNLNSHTKTSKAERQQYLTRGIIEEAIASSQLEGASTTRQYAKKMIAENKHPRTKDEWMILNNYRTLQAIDDTYKNQELSLQMLVELQASLTENTHDPEVVGRLRKDSDNIVVEYQGKVAHVPPKEAFVRQELDRLIQYVNDDNNWVHPVIKSIIIHFWIGYLHPFIDGNGRLARTLFYWYMLKNGYWAISYLPISMVIKRAPKKYAYAFIYSEQDNLDMTYFFDYHIKQVKKAIDEFLDYVDRGRQENIEVERNLEGVMLNANDRQKQIVHYLSLDSSNFVTITSHMTLSGVARGTARADILRLKKHGLIEPQKVGTNIRYFATDKLRLKKD